MGDGLNNDTEAFQKALQSVSNGAVLVPEGTYKITDRLLMDQSHVVLRGENRDKTILYFPWYLNDIDPNWGATTEGRPTSNYAWAGGYIRLEGDFGQELLTQIAEVAQRGDTEINVEDASGLIKGQLIEIHLTDTEAHSLLNFLYAGDPAETDRYKRVATTSQVTRIVEIKGNNIVLDRPLRFQTDLQWKPEVRTFSPTVQEAGVESLTFLFPSPPYEGHFTELGYNAIAMEEVAHCWVRNIRIKNSDNGIFLGGRFCTVDGVIFESEREKEPQRQSTGHHGIYISDDDNLFTSETSETGKWIEVIPPTNLYPENLHQAQLEYRLGRNEP